MPIRISDTPITRMIVPVTTGGKKRIIRLTNGRQIRIEITPAAMMAPKIVRAASGPPSVPAIAMHRSDGGEGHAHHHRQLDAEPLGHANRLDQRDDAADEKIGRDQEGHVGRVQFQRAPDDQRHGDGAGIHHQHVLQAKRKEFGWGENLVHRMNLCCSCLAFPFPRGVCIRAVFALPLRARSG